ncbi:DUF397 domain-containing protein [Nocardia sp. NPDC004654]|uniref:DUF397 domain-containing protein n=1 Tax=Nocardia sp. NPDC004654 TaxID=3154776 RepID=UPI0033A4BB86
MITEVRQGWRKSSFSNNGGASCVEVNFVGDQALLRDSKYLRDPANDPAVQPVIAMPASLWPIFCDHSLRLAESQVAGVPMIKRRDDGWVTVSSPEAGRIQLTFTPDEWTAFTAGIRNHEFIAA